MFLFGCSVKRKAFFQPIAISKNTVVWVSSTNFPNQLKYQKMLLLLWSNMGEVFQLKISTTDGLWVLLRVFICLNWIEGPVDQSKDENAIVGVCERICCCLDSEQGLSSLFNSPWRSFYQGTQPLNYTLLSHPPLEYYSSTGVLYWSITGVLL